MTNTFTPEVLQEAGENDYIGKHNRNYDRLKNFSQTTHGRLDAAQSERSALAQRVTNNENKLDNFAADVAAVEQHALDALNRANDAEQSALEAQAAATEASGYTENAAIRTTRAVIENDATLAPQANGLSVGPVTVADGATVTLLPGATWSII